MKNVFLLAPIVVALTACGTMGTSDPYAKRAEIERELPVKAVEHTLDKLPSWMSKVPSSANAIYENGTAISSDLGMADSKALAMAYGKVCMAAGGTASQQTKMYRTESEATSTELSELALKSACTTVDLTGVEVKEIKRIAEGNRYRTFVLVALPTGEANVLKRAKEAQAMREAQIKYANDRAPEAFKEMDGKDTKSSTNTKSGITLLPVDNEEYKKRRDEALKKPGAVVGQTTVQ
jgi:hypothetical protein